MEEIKKKTSTLTYFHLACHYFLSDAWKSFFHGLNVLKRTKGSISFQTMDKVQ